MANRWIGIACVLFMLSANATLFVRDVLPDGSPATRPVLDDLTRQRTRPPNETPKSASSTSTATTSAGAGPLPNDCHNF